MSRLLLLLFLLLAACGPAPDSTAVAVPTADAALATLTPTSAPLPLATATGGATAAPDAPAPPSPVPTRVAPTATTAPLPTPTAAPEPPVTFAVIGDFGSSVQGARDVAALIYEREPELLLTVGDNNYPDGAAATMAANVLEPYGTFVDSGRFFPTLGNHDMTTDNGRPYLDAFELPGNERYYEFVEGPVHFFALNSDWREPDGITAGSAQAAWLRDAMAASTAPWQVVYFHAPPYVSMAAKEVPAMRWPFVEWGADLVLAGHAHLYERLTVEGVPYVVNGLGGTAVYQFDETARDGSQVRYNADYGALFVAADSQTLSLQFITRGGEVIDELTLTR